MVKITTHWDRCNSTVKITVTTADGAIKEVYRASTSEGLIRYTDAVWAVKDTLTAVGISFTEKLDNNWDFRKD